MSSSININNFNVATVTILDYLDKHVSRKLNVSKKKYFV